MTVSTCPVCGCPADPRVLALGTTVQPHIATLVRQEHPGWTPDAGLCPECALSYARRHAALRSPSSLHTASNPPTTFPYYHSGEETVLAQPERLPDYTTFAGEGVTIAFLDSGYYPHPDLTLRPVWPGVTPVWRRLAPGQWRAVLQEAGLRIVEYVDLTNGDERVGIGTPSLWDGAGDSWHGQMTTAIAAGNGLLSGGRLRGYAPAASVLPLKIGRGDGRIPEADIQRGLEWLLADDNWQRYGVRVVNISVGGDFPQAWKDNPVSRSAHALAQRGVFVAAAAGNRGVQELLPPAQTPSVMTVGGVDDQNRRWRPCVVDEVERLALYHHNYDSVVYRHTLVRKPELLALSCWLPAPVLPVSPVFQEMIAIDRVRQVLLDVNENGVGSLPTYRQAGVSPATASTGGASVDGEAWMPEVWEGLRKRMNGHKWVHPYYQHVDGTSVAVAQVSAVAAQMLQANPNLQAQDVRRLLLETSLPLPHLVPRQTGAGLLQPALAVAAALRTGAGPLVGRPQSATVLGDSELHKMMLQGTLSVLSPQAQGTRTRPLYIGYYAPEARAVSLVGEFNCWQPGTLPLQRAANGWWHAVVQLAPGSHLYRFWIEDANHPQGLWRRDPENPNLEESGYADDHSLICV